MKKSYIIITLLLFVISLHSFSQGLSTKGTDFWISFGGNRAYTYGNITLQVRIATIDDTEVTFTYTESNTVETYSILAGTVHTITLNTTEKSRVFSDVTGTSQKSLHVTSTKPVSVYALNQQSITTDATNILPTNNLGTEYYHISYISASHPDGYTIIATDDATTIYEDGILKATLNKGDVYSSYYTVGADATGKHITSNKPVSYFVTNRDVKIPVGVNFSDNIFQQLPPVNQWGNHFLVPMTTQRIGRLRILASEDGTSITQTGGTIITGTGGQTSLSGLNAGQFVEINIGSTGCYIISDKPVGVCSYLISSGNVSAVSPKGDPAMTWVPPIEQVLSGITITQFPVTSSTIHYAVVLTPTATKEETNYAIGIANLEPLTDVTWTNNLESGYSFGSVVLTSDNSYTFQNSNGLMVLGYGLGVDVSYYYLAGSAARNLDAAFYINDEHYQDIDSTSFCGVSQFNFEAEIKYALSTVPGYLRWYINNVEQLHIQDQITWNTSFAPGTYTIKMVVLDMDGDSYTLSSTITVLDVPSVEPIDDITACLGEKISEIGLIGNSSDIIFEWSGGASAGLDDGYGNNEIDEFTAIGSASVQVKPIFSQGTTECTGEPVEFDIYTKIPSPGSIYQNEYIWTGGSTINNSWNNAENWLRYSGGTYYKVYNSPLITTNVRIMSFDACVYNPVITSDENSVCNDIAIANTKLTLNNSKLNVYGSWLNNGSFQFDNSTTIIFKGNSLNHRIIKSAGSVFSNIRFDFDGELDLFDELIVNVKAEFFDGIVNGDAIFMENSTTSTEGTSFINGYVTKYGVGSFVFPIGDVNSRTFHEDHQDIEYTVLGNLGVIPSSSSLVPEITIKYNFSNEDMPSWWHTSNNIGEELHHVSDREHWQIISNVDIDRLYLYWHNNDNCITHDLAEVCMHSFCDPHNVGELDVSTLSVAVSDGGVWHPLSSSGIGDHVNGYIYSQNRLTINNGAKSLSKDSQPLFVTYGTNEESLPLPVEFLDFIVKAGDNSILLDWITLSEVNNNYFEIERSKDAHNFESIAIVKGGGFSNRMLSYHYEDMNVIPGETYYYRIKQVDYNDDYEYSVVRSVKLACVNTDLSIYPNPANDYIELQFDEDNFIIEIYNYRGQEILTDVNNKKINIGHFPAGIYTIKVIVSGNNVIYKSFIKE